MEPRLILSFTNLILPPLCFLSMINPEFLLGILMCRYDVMELVYNYRELVLPIYNCCIFKRMFVTAFKMRESAF